MVICWVNRSCIIVSKSKFVDGYNLDDSNVACNCINVIESQYKYQVKYNKCANAQGNPFGKLQCLGFYSNYD